MSLRPRGCKQGPHKHPANRSLAVCTTVGMLKYSHGGKWSLPQLQTCRSLSLKTLTFP